MWARVNWFAFFLALQNLFWSASSIQIWPSPGALPAAIPAKCRVALSQNITCSPDLVSARSVASGRALDKKTLAAYCTTSCYTSLQTFKTNVDTSCGNTLYQMFVNSTFLQSGAAVADPLAWAYNVTCVKDNTGFCLPALYNGTKAACSDCALQYTAAMLSSDYGRAKIQPKAFSSLLSSCSVPASKYPYKYTSTSIASSTSTRTSVPVAKCTGTRYTVAAQDTCQSISKAKSIAIDWLISSNNLDYNCLSLTAGTTLCLGPTCALQTITKNQTCQDITANKRFTSVQLISWNPIIHSTCDNLDSMVGRSICVSPPGTSSYSAVGLNVTGAAPISSMFPGPYVTGNIVASPTRPVTSWYNLQTTYPKPPTTTITANLTAASLIATRTAYCPITPQDYDTGFEDSDLTNNCQDLIGPYCYPDPDKPVPKSTKFPVSCTPDRPVSTSTIAKATNTVPSPLEPSTIPSCLQYYHVLDGDTCFNIAKNFGITLTQFNTWNPYIGSDCQKLFLGYYVCIKA